MDTEVINTPATSGKWRLRRARGSPCVLAVGTRSKRGRRHTCPSKQKQQATEEGYRGYICFCSLGPPAGPLGPGCAPCKKLHVVAPPFGPR